MDLSMVEIISLDALIRYGGPIVRHSLYVIVNEYIKNERISLSKIRKEILPKYEKKFYNYLDVKYTKNSDLSTSSFYNNLKALEERGFIKFNRNEKDRVETVEATPLTKQVIKYLLQFFMDLSAIPDLPEFDRGLAQLIQEKSGLQRLENLLVMWFERHVSLRLIKFLGDYSDEIFVLSKIEDYNEYNTKELEKVHFSRILNRKIREPDDVFEAVILPVYEKNIDFFKMDRIDVLKEIYRLLRLNGMIVIVCKAEFKTTNDIAADELLNIYKDSISDTIFNMKELDEDLALGGFDDIEIFPYKGMLVALAFKKKI
jgi:DNA-binding PadR family transcriptional regulator